MEIPFALQLELARAGKAGLALGEERVDRVVVVGVERRLREQTANLPFDVLYHLGTPAPARNLFFYLLAPSAEVAEAGYAQVAARWQQLLDRQRAVSCVLPSGGTRCRPSTRDTRSGVGSEAFQAAADGRLVFTRRVMGARWAWRLGAELGADAGGGRRG